MQVNNTDAEGRLTLADALLYACDQGVDKVILTSAIGTPKNRDISNILLALFKMM